MGLKKLTILLMVAILAFVSGCSTNGEANKGANAATVASNLKQKGLLFPVRT
ncbi:hypothetical protein N752_20080 [Desulforamulus aquiferis]|nr:hypothetical protein N752_20080 [Desulforamulus aquiferis]